MRAVSPAVVPVVALDPIASLARQVHVTGYGLYLLTRYKEIEIANGQSRMQFTFEDATGRMTGFGWPEDQDAILIPPLPSPVSVLGRVKLHGDQPQLTVKSLAGVNAAAVPRATDLLPRHRGPDSAQAAFDRLAKLEGSLPAPLDGFLREVLLAPEICASFLCCRGSVSHHHAFVGGLLAHCTEMLDFAEAIARFALPDDAWSPHLARLGYLLHDLGKIRTVGEHRRPDYALTVRHEVLTIELMAPHLTWLERREPTLAVGLRSIFDYLVIPKASRSIPNYFVAELVEKLDHWSSARHEPRGLDYLLHNGRHGRRPLHLAAPEAANDPVHSRARPRVV